MQAVFAMAIASGGSGSIVKSFNSMDISLFNREGSKKILSIAGMLKSSPSLLSKTMGKAKKEEAMQESHCNDGGMEDLVMGTW
jgi:hypothetical protein